MYEVDWSAAACWIDTFKATKIMEEVITEISLVVDLNVIASSILEDKSSQQKFC
jgi:hypothetical protein